MGGALVSHPLKKHDQDWYPQARLGSGRTLTMGTKQVQGRKKAEFVEIDVNTSVQGSPKKLKTEGVLFM